MKRKQTIKEWEIETGIKVNNPKGFRGQKNKVYNTKYSAEAFRIGITTSCITIKTEKGMKFYNGQVEDNFMWECFIDFKNNRKKDREFKPRFKSRR